MTDTWFDGSGPELAERAKTKDGLFRAKVGIVLLCNEHGYPLRWDVLPGRQHDSRAMHDMLGRIQGPSWARGVPVVCDRAMGNTAHIRKMLDSGLHFPTALTVNEFGSYTDAVPHGPMSDLELGLTDGTQKADVALAAQAANDAGLTQLTGSLYVRDLGVIEVDVDETDGQAEDRHEGEDKTVRAMRLARRARQALDDGQATSYRAAGHVVGLTKSQVAHYLHLVQLPKDVQQAILDGQAVGLSLNDLLRLAAIEEEGRQRSEFERLIRDVAPRRDGHRGRPVSRGDDTGDDAEQQQPTRVRAVVCFNPEMLVEQRRHARERLVDIEAFVTKLNASLASPRSRRKLTSISGEVGAKLRRHDLVDAFEVDIDESEQQGRTRYQVRLTLKPDQWARRERYRGFSLLVGHPGLSQGAPELARLYRAKDALEKDFGVLKGVIKLRPVRHRTDPKVRAHVTLCMLALLLERTLERQLAGIGRSPWTAAAALDLLRTCHLNQEGDGDSALPVYSATRANEDQRRLLRALQLDHLADQKEIADRIVPR